MLLRESVSAPARRHLTRRPAPPPTPRLVNGDRLTRVEFERRYAASPDVHKAELIEGIVYGPSRQRIDHGECAVRVASWLEPYVRATPGVMAASNSTDRLDEDNEPQPDHLLGLLPETGGQSRVDAQGYLCGGPELVVEIALSSASYDLHQKKEVYRRHGVVEYVVVLLDDPEVRWFHNREGVFEDFPSGRDGIFRSEVFPGLWLEPRALLAGDGKRVVAVLDRGLRSKAHALFRRALAARMRAARHRR
ncbi:MAG: Uma2 family endonuclease [Planctomycetes bacterium]|nr:Uma2 family endonuclease [Planctomycetota bacterium]